LLGQDVDVEPAADAGTVVDHHEAGIDLAEQPSDARGVSGSDALGHAGRSRGGQPALGLGLARTSKGLS
jgi:hypothetical protein